MSLTIRNQIDFFSGCMFIAAGTAFAIGATRYEIGTAAQMGAGYFSLVLGILLAALGSVISIRSFLVPSEGGGRVGPLAWRPLIFIIAANLAFGAMLGGLPSIGLPAMGLIAAIYALVFIASLASTEFNVKGVAVLATVLALSSYLVFIVLLRLPFLVWPEFLTN